MKHLLMILFTRQFILRKRRRGPVLGLEMSQGNATSPDGERSSRSLNSTVFYLDVFKSESKRHSRAMPPRQLGRGVVAQLNCSLFRYFLNLNLKDTAGQCHLASWEEKSRKLIRKDKSMIVPITGIVHCGHRR